MRVILGMETGDRFPTTQENKTGRMIKGGGIAYTTTNDGVLHGGDHSPENKASGQFDAQEKRISRLPFFFLFLDSAK